MTLDQKIQVWNAVGTWVAGIATFAAVLVSLYLARAAGRVKIKAYVGLRQLVGRGVRTEDLLQFGVTNVGERAVTISNIGWVIGKRSNRRNFVQLFGSPMSASIPRVLMHGERADFLVLFSERPSYMSDLAHDLIQAGDPSILKTLIAEIDTSVGQTVRIKPEKAFLDKLAAEYVKRP